MARPLRFGLSVVPYAADYEGIVEQVRIAEERGLDLVGIQDHPYQRRYLDTYSLIADLLARTERLRFFPDVTSLAMRDPPMIAKAAASMDVMSGGRIRARPRRGELLERGGRHGPAGADEPPGVRGARRGDRDHPRRPRRGSGEARGAVGRGRTTRSRAIRPDRRPRIGSASGWACTGRAGSTWPAALQTDGSPRSVTWDLTGWPRPRGRSTRRRAWPAVTPDEITRVVNLGGSITDGERGDDLLTGPVERWVATLTSWATEIGIDSFIFWAADGDANQVRRFADEVAPAVRERVGR